jgi:hypothetical protein
MMTAQSETTSCFEMDPQMTVEYRTQSCSWGWPLFGALIGLFGGTVAAILGSVFTVVSWITNAEVNGVFMQSLGTDFFLLTIPLLVLGAHCLDVVEKGKKNERKSKFDENS